MNIVDPNNIRDNKIGNLQEIMSTMVQAPCPVKHSFMPGMYLREVNLAADTVAIGHYQKDWHINVFVKGRVTMFMPDGTTKEIQAPMTFLAPPGKKCGYVHEDTTWINIYSTTETDINTLESTIFDLSQSSVLPRPSDPVLIGNDNDDYSKLLLELNTTDICVYNQSDDTSDLTALPFGQYSFKISDSNIAGKGVFATANITKGSIIGPARIGDKRTVIGRYANHSVNPNAEFVVMGDCVFAVALCDINGCCASIDGEEITTNYRHNLLINKESLCQE